MWRSGWTWLRIWRRAKPRGRADLADMGIDIGLDQSLESRFPPLLEDAAFRPHTRAGQKSLPLGTDLRSQLR
jgi:hypothetical protein